MPSPAVRLLAIALGLALLACSDSGQPDDAEPARADDLRLVESVIVPLPVSAGRLRLRAGTASLHIENPRANAVTLEQVEFGGTDVKVTLFGLSDCSSGRPGALHWNREGRALVRRSEARPLPVTVPPGSRELALVLKLEAGAEADDLLVAGCVVSVPFVRLRVDGRWIVSTGADSSVVAGLRGTFEKGSPSTCPTPT